MKFFDVSCMKIDFNQEMIASVVSPSSSSLLVTALFRTKGDFAGLSYYSNEPGQHIKALCPFTRNYSGTKLAFTFSMTGNGVAFSNTTHKPSLTIVSGEEEYYITLGLRLPVPWCLKGIHLLGIRG